MNPMSVEQDPENFLTSLYRSILSDQARETESLLQLAEQRLVYLQHLRQYRSPRGDTLLHLAALFHRKAKPVEKFLDLCPELLPVSRQGALKGQNVLHIAISKVNHKVVQTILKHASIGTDVELKRQLLEARAVGSRFANTVLMGELPLTVAALTLNLPMVQLLLKNGARLSATNSLGDTVFHSLIRYADVFPEKGAGVIIMMTEFHRMLPQRYHLATWSLENADRLTPLKLAASLGQDEIFSRILHLEGVYCHLDEHDGVVDIRLFDITEIDTAAQVLFEKGKLKASISKGTRVTPLDDSRSSLDKSSCQLSNRLTSLCKQSRAVMEIVCNIDVQNAFCFIAIPVVRDTIKLKWLGYRKFYYVWMVVHVAVMSLLTAYAIYKTKFINSVTKDGNTTLTHNSIATSEMPPPQTTLTAAEVNFVHVWGYLAPVYGLIYIVMELRRSFCLRQCWHLGLRHHNGLYRLTLLVFSSGLIVDSVLFIVQTDNSYFLLLSLLTGWWFLTFFLRTHKKFSFFTVMFQKILLGDMLRFSTVIFLELLSFSIAMYITFLGAFEKEEFCNLGATMLTLFKLMLGLADVDILYEAKAPWLAVTLFVMFVLITYVLLINSLVAMMSQTCAVVSQDRYTHWELQRLSVILLLESMIPTRFWHVPGQPKYLYHHDLSLGERTEEQRFVITIQSGQTDYSDGRAILKRKLLMRTERLNGLNLLPTPSRNLYYQNTSVHAEDEAQVKKNNQLDYSDTGSEVITSDNHEQQENTTFTTSESGVTKISNASPFNTNKTGEKTLLQHLAQDPSNRAARGSRGIISYDHSSRLRVQLPDINNLNSEA